MSAARYPVDDTAFAGWPPTLRYLGSRISSAVQLSRPMVRNEMVSGETKRIRRMSGLRKAVEVRHQETLRLAQTAWSSGSRREKIHAEAEVR
jgi:hypothetical protein